MDDRRSSLLTHIVRSYVREAEPVGSKTLEGALGISSATIRNEMVALEDEGYLAQPHTSAGRVPTAKGYQYYVQHVAQPKEPSQPEQRTLAAALREQRGGPDRASRNVAKRLAEVSGEAVVVGFGPYDVFYTGLSNLFSQPEFREFDMVLYMSRAIDHLDEAMRQLYRLNIGEVEVKLGEQNPFGEDCAFIMARAGREQLFGILGPLRMDYDANLGRMHYVRTLFN